ncbi:hypothetical protein [Halosimplex pelagicum]|uniref:Uncharacterized protein n=1 Tax=Halosimplex pelagicum TaxID=869886 RepID=A0A7D5PCA4_9EURY|nr:hypothetical protein [Halosimplex pelagicum]QLH83022.1 hypothetical protein HZS54_15925 [Halosimplex pelagicum]
MTDEEKDDEESELEMNERQRQVLECGGDIEVSEDTEELVADAPDETDEDGDADD